MSDKKETIHWKIEGMTCANCALTISNYLKKQGAAQIQVNPVSNELICEISSDESFKTQLKKGIGQLGYRVQQELDTTRSISDKEPMNQYLIYLLCCAPFTLLLLLHMFHEWLNMHWLMNPYVQLGLSVPVYSIGMYYFGRSAVVSLRNGMPNMNVLITIGATAAFSYSLYGTLIGQGAEYLFYETAATIITLVFLGNYLEDASIQHTQRALKKLAKSQKVMANMIAFDDKHEEQIFQVENTALRVGDLLLIKSGEQVPADCKILWGDATVNEGIITGESLPITKKQKDTLIGGSLLQDGTVKAQVTAAAKDSALANIVNLVKQAQGEKPPVQQMADKISAVFVPVVLGIALITFLANWFVLHQFTEALMRSIAVLVIACPCAMGLATPAAIAVGLGRAARNGVLFRNAKSLELFKNIKQAVFDKTGTLTTGKFTLAGFQIQANSLSEAAFKSLVYSLERYSNHPIAVCIAGEWKTKEEYRWAEIEEVKGLGMRAKDQEGNEYIAGSYAAAAAFTTDSSHNVYVLKNNQLLGWVDVKDELREESSHIIQYLKARGIKTVLLSGDRKEKCRVIAEQLGIDEVMAEKRPEEKLKIIEELNQAMPTAMIGDGINDAPALARATIGISLSEASQIAVQTADVVLMNHGLKNLPLSLGLGRHTYITIRQNLFWAFFYNIIAIPIAAFGFLTPTFGALVMGMSDVVLAINSVRLFVKKVT
ncbi:MAG: cadmium-translocating P-type ATPase [Bacteroidetes bacterium]|nr:cadmium-translocating P-type ATPase [Bacteroidota bacterium]